MIKSGKEYSRIKGFFTKKNEDVIIYIYRIKERLFEVEDFVPVYTPMV